MAIANNQVWNEIYWLRSHLGFFYYSKVKFTIVSVFFYVTGFSHFTKVNGSSSLSHWQRRQDKRKVYHSIKSSWIAFVYQKFIKRCFFSWPPSIAPALGTCLQSNIHPENEDNLLKVSFQTEKQAYNKYPFQKGVEQKKTNKHKFTKFFSAFRNYFLSTGSLSYWCLFSSILRPEKFEILAKLEKRRLHFTAIHITLDMQYNWDLSADHTCYRQKIKKIADNANSTVSRLNWSENTKVAAM